MNNVELCTFYIFALGDILYASLRYPNGIDARGIKGVREFGILLRHLISMRGGREFKQMKFVS